MGLIWRAFSGIVRTPIAFAADVVEADLDLTAWVTERVKDDFEMVVEDKNFY